LNTAPVIEVRDLSHRHGAVSALSGVRFTVGVGEFVGLIGPNSAGKSTLLRLMSGALPTQQGAVSIAGRAVRDWPLRELARTLAVVAPESEFAFPFTVSQVVLMGRTPYQGWGWRASTEDQQAAHRALQRTDTLALRDRPIDTLSSGERQRVLLARALAQEPQVLLLDEPTSHLDVGHQWRFFDLLRELHGSERVTIVCAVHDLALAARYCDRLLLLHAGRLVADGRPVAVLSPAHLKDFFGIDADVVQPVLGQPRYLTLIPTSERISS
jgi:iron complex transport system ATP-binding protein